MCSEEMRSQSNADRVLRAPIKGTIFSPYKISDYVHAGDVIAEIRGEDTVPLTARVSGVLRGMLRDGSSVMAGLKVGDIDERADPSYCTLVSDKALAIGGGVLEAILTAYSDLPGLMRA